MQKPENHSPFHLSCPLEQSAPIVANSPHSGRFYPENFLSNSRLNHLSIRKSEDFMVDEIAKNSVDHGIPLLSAVYPRAYLDVNREPYELDPSMFSERLPDHVNTRSIRVSSGLGTVPRIVSEGEEIYSYKLPTNEAFNRISNVYRPYHSALQNLLARTHVKFGLAVLLDIHSMPSSNAAPNGDRRGDIVLGDRFGSSCDPRILHHAKSVFKSMGYQVEINRPYAGGFITEHYGRPLKGLHALQIEINRALYMDEIRIRQSRHFEELVENFDRFFEEFAVMDMSGLQGSHPLAAE
ncbi:MAG: N-formylglutamate amidohydrolase [Pseudomonadota bacterium]